MSEELLPLVTPSYLQKTVETRMKSCDNHLVGKRKEAGHYSGLYTLKFFGWGTTPNAKRITKPFFPACPQCW